MKKTAVWVMGALMLFAAGVAEAAPKYTIEVTRKWYGKPYIRIVAENGKTVAHGETLHNFLDAMDTAQNIADGEFEVVDRFHD